MGVGKGTSTQRGPGLRNESHGIRFPYSTLFAQRGRIDSVRLPARNNFQRRHLTVLAHVERPRQVFRQEGVRVLCYIIRVIVAAPDTRCLRQQEG